MGSVLPTFGGGDGGDIEGEGALPTEEVRETKSLRSDNEDIRRKLASINEEDAAFIQLNEAGLGQGLDRELPIVTLRYRNVPEGAGRLKAADLASLEGIDIDGDGHVSLAELLHLERKAHGICRRALFIGVLVVLFLGWPFLITWGITQTKQAANSYDRSRILQTARAEIQIPVKFIPLLPFSQLSRVSQVTLTGFFLSKGGPPCELCASSLVVQVFSFHSLLARPLNEA